MKTIGHNERSYRLDALALEARRGLENVEKGEEFTIGGWLAYGFALNEGRALFPGDREFGQWVEQNVHSQLARAPGPDERAAAMWAAANAEQFEEARQRGNPRTIRGIHAKWKEIEAERQAARVKEERQILTQAKQHSRTAAIETPRVTMEAEPNAQIEARCDIKSASDAKTRQEGVAGTEMDTQASLINAATASDPYAEDRRSLAGLTRAALEDEVLGLRAALAEEQARRIKAEAERDDWKARFNQTTSESDLGRSLGLALRQRDTAKGRLGEELTKNVRQARRIKILEAELAKLQRSVEQQEIALR